jgi:hypothetical protein
MGFLDGILGGVVGAEALSLVKDYIEKHGGIAGVVSEFEKNGFGQQVKSWAFSVRSCQRYWAGRLLPRSLRLKLHLLRIPVAR